jgi:hypothetical protein
MFTFNAAIPASNNNPSVDQPVMLQNNIATNGILAVDHVTFNETQGGTHKQVTFSSENLPTTPLDPISVLYTNPGTASTNAELFYINASGTFLLSSIKAFAAITGSTGVALSQFNIPTISRTSAGRYNLTLSPNVVTGTNWGVVVSLSQSTTGIWTANYTVGSGGTLAIGINLYTSNFTGTATDPISFTVAVIQV